MKTSTQMSSPLQRWQSLVNGQRAHQLGAGKLSEFQRAGALHTVLLPRISNHVLMCVSQTCAAPGGAGHMTLADWRDAEEQLKRKIGYEKCNTHS